MSKKQFQHGIDMGGVSQLKNMILHNVTYQDLEDLSFNLTVLNTGLLVYNIENDSPYIWDGSTFLEITTEIQGDVIYRGSIDASQSLNTQCEAIAGYQYLVENSGELSMDGITFITENQAETGDMLLFTSDTQAVIMQAGSIRLATTDEPGSSRYSTESELLSDDDSTVISANSLDLYLSQKGYIRQFSEYLPAMSAGVPVRIFHGLRLEDKDNFSYNIMKGSSRVNMEVRAVNQSYVDVTSFTDISDVRITLVGKSRKQTGEPVITALRDLSDADISQSITDADQFKIIISSDIGDTIEVYDGQTLLGTATETSEPGVFELIVGPLLDGEYDITATRVVDGQQELSSEPYNITIDTTPPSVPVITVYDDNSDVVNENAYTNSEDFTLSISTDPGITVYVFNNGVSQGIAVESSSQGVYNFQLTDNSDGDYALSAVAEDSAGNTSSSVVTNFQRDTTPPSTPVIQELRKTNSSGELLSSGDLINDDSFFVSVSTESSVDVKIYINGTSAGTLAEYTPGIYQTTVNIPQQGSTEITIESTDQAGNTSVSDTFSLILDSVSPAAPVITSVRDLNDTDVDFINQEIPVKITLSAEQSGTVEVYINAVLDGEAQEVSPGVYEYTTETLLEGDYIFSSRITDEAGNRSGRVGDTLVSIDLTTVKPIFTDMTEDTGESSSDYITGDTEIVLKLTAENYSTVEIYRDTVYIGEATATTPGSTVYEYNTGVLPDGTYDFVAKSTDRAGNTAFSDALTVTIDSTLPVTPVITQITDLDSSVVTDTVRSTKTPLTLEISAETQTYVEVFNNGVSIGQATETSSAGVYEFDTLPYGTSDTKVFTANSTDTAGNTSAMSQSREITIDTGSLLLYDNTTYAGDWTASGYSFTQVVEQYDKFYVRASTANSGEQTFTSPETFSMDLDKDYRLTFYLDTGSGGYSYINIGPFTVNGRYNYAGIISDSIPDSTIDIESTKNQNNFWDLRLYSISETELEVRVYRDDVLQGSQTFDKSSVPTEYYQDVSSIILGFDDESIAVSTSYLRGLPRITEVLDEQGVSTLINQDEETSTIRISADPLATVSVYSNDTLLGNATEVSSGNFEYNTGVLVDGTYIFTAFATADEVEYGVSREVTYIVDVAPPEVPVISSISSENGLVLITITAETESTVEVFDQGESLGTAQENGTTGIFTLQTQVSDVSAYSFTASSTDKGGNTTVSSTVDQDIPSFVAEDLSGTPVIQASFINENSLILTVLTASGQTVEVYNDEQLMGSATETETLGTYVYETGTISDGEYNIRVRVEYDSGNMYTQSQLLTFTVDTVNPTVPVFSQVVNSQGDTLTSGTKSFYEDITFTVAAEEGSSVGIYVDGVYQDDMTETETPGVFEYSYYFPLGYEYTVVARSQDLAGNYTESAEFSIIIDWPELNLTMVGSSELSDLSPYASGSRGSIYLDNAQEPSYLMIDTMVRDIGNSPYTVEFWFNYEGDDFNKTVYRMFGSLTNDPVLIHEIANKRFQYYVDNSNVASNYFNTVGEIGTGEWHHIALCYDGSKLRGYIDGQKLIDQNYTTRLWNSVNQEFWIGAQENVPNVGLEGYISDFRISSVARYSDSFALPTQPFIRDAYTQFLLETEDYMSFYFKNDAGDLFYDGGQILDRNLTLVVESSSGRSIEVYQDNEFIGYPVEVSAGIYEIELLELEGYLEFKASTINSNGDTFTTNNTHITAGIADISENNITLEIGEGSTGEKIEISSLSPYSGEGNTSIYFPGTSYIEVPNLSSIGPSVFTLETWVNTSTTGRSGRFAGSNVRSNSPLMLVNTNRTVSYITGSGLNLTSSVTVQLNEWFHFAISQTLTNVYMFIDGVLVASGAAQTSGTGGWAADDFRIGGHPLNGGAYSFDGYLVDFRIVLGEAIYTTGFTPPSEPLTAIPGTYLLIKTA